MENRLDEEYEQIIKQAKVLVESLKHQIDVFIVKIIKGKDLDCG